MPRLTPSLVKQINADLASRFRDTAHDWVDLTNFLNSDDSGLTKDMTYNGVHLTDLAYYRWNAKLRLIVK